MWIATPALTLGPYTHLPYSARTPVAGTAGTASVRLRLENLAYFGPSNPLDTLGAARSVGVAKMCDGSGTTRV